MYGLDSPNPNNWTAVIESYADPLKSGRLRVRINGFHNLDKTILPTEDLPWAQVAVPVNGSATTHAPKIGDWVIGFFLDGTDAQFPIVTHVLPGINTVLVKQPVGAPKMPAGQLGFSDRPGEPSLPPLAREIVRFTAIDTSNRSRAHVCDISYEVDQTVAAIKTLFGPVFDVIRKLINAAIGATCYDPTGFSKTIVDIVRKVTAFIKEFTRVVKEIQKTVSSWLEVARKVKAMIDYILSLPAKAAAFFTDCVRKFTAILQKGLKDLFSDLAGDVDTGGLGEVISAVQDGADAVQDLANSGARLIATVQPATLAAVILAPTSQSEVDAAGVAINKLISDADPITSPLDVGQGP
jgi:hypothetical protein